jgi:hypothetical protein
LNIKTLPVVKQKIKIHNYGGNEQVICHDKLDEGVSCMQKPQGRLWKMQTDLGYLH